MALSSTDLVAPISDLLSRFVPDYQCLLSLYSPLSPWFVLLSDSYYPTPLFHRTDFPQSHTVDIPQELKDSIRKFRFTRHKGNAALVVKINKQRLIMEEVETFDDITPEELAEGTAC